MITYKTYSCRTLSVSRMRELDALPVVSKTETNKEMLFLLRGKIPQFY